MNVARTQDHEEGEARSRWSYLLYGAWVTLAAWLTLAFSQGHTLRDDWVALPGVAFCVTSAVIGSRIFVYLQDRKAEHSTEQVEPLPSAG